MILRFFVPGVPVPQGSKVAAQGGGKVWLRDANGAKLRPWRQAVEDRAREFRESVGFTTVEGPVLSELWFYMPRPKSHFGTGRNAEKLKASAPPVPTSRHDLDKLVRSVHDSLTNAGVWKDDGQVVQLVASKLYTPDSGVVGVDVRISPWGTPDAEHAWDSLQSAAA